MLQIAGLLRLYYHLLEVPRRQLLFAEFLGLCSCLRVPLGACYHLQRFHRTVAHHLGREDSQQHFNICVFSWSGCFVGVPGWSWQIQHLQQKPNEMVKQILLCDPLLNLAAYTHFIILQILLNDKAALCINHPKDKDL